MGVAGDRLCPGFEHKDTRFRMVAELLEAIWEDDDQLTVQALKKYDDLTRTLFDSGSTLPRDLRRWGAVHLAAFMGSVKSLRAMINHGFDLSDFDCKMLPHMAAAGGNFEVIRELDNLGLDWVSRFAWEHPAEYAARWGRLEVLQWLWVRGYLMSSPVCGWAPPCNEGDDPEILRSAARGGHLAIIEFLVEEVRIPFASRPGRFGMCRSAMISAAEGGHAGVLKWLLDRGRDATCLACRRWFPCGHRPQSLCHTPLSLAALVGSISSVSVLAGRSPENVWAIDPLTASALAGHADVARFLLPSSGERSRSEAYSVALVLARRDLLQVLGSQTYLATPLVCKVRLALQQSGPEP